MQGIDHAVGVRQVVGIVPALQIPVVAAAAPHIRGQRHGAAVAGGVVAGGEAAVVGAHHALGVLHGLLHVFVVAVQALVHLIGGGVHQVVVPVACVPLALHGVGARGHRLGLQGLQRPGIAHLVGHHAAEVVLDADGEHRAQAAVLVARDREIARVEVVPLGFGDVHAVLVIIAGLAGEGQGIAHVQRESPHAEVDRVAAVGEHDLRVPIEAEARVVLHGVHAREPDRQVLRVGEGLQVHAQHAVVLDGAVFDAVAAEAEQAQRICRRAPGQQRS